MKNEYTEIDGTHVCNDCGAYADAPVRVQHHATCKPGECKRWEAHYEQANIEETEMVNRFKVHRIIVAGSRDFTNYGLLKRKLHAIFHNIVANGDRIEIVSGTARGTDKLGERYAKDCHHTVKRFPAKWKTEHGAFDRSAGFKRNEVMAKYATHLVAFWDGKSVGTEYMIELAEKHGLKVRIIRY